MINKFRSPVNPLGNSGDMPHNQSFLGWEKASPGDMVQDRFNEWHHIIQEQNEKYIAAINRKVREFPRLRTDAKFAELFYLNVWELLEENKQENAHKVFGPIIDNMDNWDAAQENDQFTVVPAVEESEK